MSSQCSPRSGHLTTACLGLLSLAVLLISCGPVLAQCHLPTESPFGERTANSSKSPAESLLPESGLLTDDAYSSLYFGFSLRLPIPLQGHRLMLPIRLPGEHALLAIGFQDSLRYGTFVITAGGRHEEDHRMTPEQAQARENEIAHSMPGTVAPDLPKFTPPPVHFKRIDKHSGDVRGTQFSARIRDYTVHFTVQTNDKTFLDKSHKAVAGVRVFCTDGAGSFFTADGKPFRPEGAVTNGPTIPTAIVDEAIRSRPAEQTIPAGTFEEGKFQIPELDFSYSLPGGWLLSQQPPAPAEDPGSDELAQRLDYLWRACARTPLWAQGGASGVAKLELRVLDQSCLGLPFPASATDALGSESLGEYLQMLGAFGQIKSNRLVQAGGRLFSVYVGTTATGPAVHNLEQRDADVIVTTRYNKLIFAWRWSTPTESELRQVPASEARFGSTAPIAVGPGMVSSQTSSQP